jgi:Ca2+-binding EF-hand superfamily protein
MSQRGRHLAGVLAGFALAAVMVTAWGAESEKNRNQNLQAGSEETKELLRLMDKDKNGKVSKKEFMSFMEAEFERLDTDKSGELDVTELQQIRIATGKHPGGSGGK